jgi:phosphoserine aminotransferase
LGSNKRNKTLEKPLSLLLQQLKTTIIFQKDMQYLQMLIIFMHEQQYHFGTQMKEFPATNIPVVCDMSSDIFSRVLDFSKFDLIYAGAQKIWTSRNYSDCCKEEILGKTGRMIPSMLDYTKHIKAESMYNTPLFSGLRIIDLAVVEKSRWNCSY